MAQFMAMARLVLLLVPLASAAAVSSHHHDSKVVMDAVGHQTFVVDPPLDATETEGRVVKAIMRAEVPPTASNGDMEHHQRQGWQSRHASSLQVEGPTPAPRPRPTPRPTPRPAPRPTPRPAPRPTPRPAPRPTPAPAPSYHRRRVSRRRTAPRPAPIPPPTFAPMDEGTEDEGTREHVVTLEPTPSPTTTPLAVHVGAPTPAADSTNTTNTSDNSTDTASTTTAAPKAAGGSMMFIGIGVGAALLLCVCGGLVYNSSKKNKQMEQEGAETAEGMGYEGDEGYDEGYGEDYGEGVEGEYADAEDQEQDGQIL